MAAMHPQSKSSSKPAQGSIRGELRLIARTLFAVLALLWVIELVDLLVLDGKLDGFGVHPRELVGLIGLATAPFLHGGLGHLLSNTIGFLIFGTLVLMWGRREFVLVSIAAWLSAGVGMWLFGSAGSVHIGASGVVFGYFGYLITRGFYERRFLSILLSLAIALVFGGMLSGAVPGLAGTGISWEGHLFGLLGGVLIARRFRAGRQANAD